MCFLGHTGYLSSITEARVLLKDKMHQVNTVAVWLLYLFPFSCEAWWLCPVVPTLRRLRQEFEGSWVTQQITGQPGVQCETRLKKKINLIN